MTPQEAIDELKYLISRDCIDEIEFAIKALEKQIPKKPMTVTDPMFGDVELRCPRCDNANLANPFRCNGYDYCPDCGQALDWGDE